MNDEIDAAGTAGDIEFGDGSKLGWRATALAGVSLGVTCGLLFIMESLPPPLNVSVSVETPPLPIGT